MQSTTVTRNWLAYICESLVASGAMPSWDAAQYLNDNLFGDSPNPRLHETKAPYEAIWQFLHRIYQPIVEAASRTVELPEASMIHVFTDVSLIGNSAVLLVYFPGNNQPHQLLLMDAVRAWDLIFPDTRAFNAWADERFRWIKEALEANRTKATATQPALVEVAR